MFIEDSEIYRKITKEMGFIKTFTEFLFEYQLHPHFRDRWNLRAKNFTVVSTGGANVDRKDLIERVQELLAYKDKKLQSAPGTAQKIARVVDFGDIQIKLNNKIYFPVFSVRGEESGKMVHYGGSCFCALTVSNEAITLKLYPRDASVNDKINDLEKHFTEKGTVEKFAGFEHEYLNNRVNMIDMNIPFDEYVKQFKEPEKTSFFQYEVEKEATIRKGTEVGQKIVKDLQKNKDGSIFLIFTDGTMKKVVKGGKWTLNDGFYGKITSIGTSTRISDKNNILIKVKGEKSEEVTSQTSV